jgi:PEP-CTERM motif
MSINPGNGTTNTSLIEATNGATLNLGGSFTNTGGTILSMGSGSTVNLSGAATSTITGGTLTTSGGGAMISDGSTLIGVTISSGSTVSTTNNNTTTLSGTITNNGTIALNSGGNYTDLILSGNVTLAGTGAISMSDYASNRIYGGGSDQLINGAGHTIEGSGQLGIGGGNAFGFINNGTVLANQSVSLVVDPGNGLTNNGTMQVNAGSALEVLGGITNTGTVNVGQAGQAGSSLFLMGDAHDFVQTGGTTTLWTSGSNLELQSGQSMLLQGGTLQGFGTIAGNLSNTGGTVLPGTTGVAGILTVTGNYSDPMGSVLDIQIGGSVAGSGFSQLDVLGTASLAGTLDVNLLNGFTPTNGEEFVILTSGGLSGSFTDGVIHDGNVTFTVYYSPAGFANDVVLNAVVVSSVPEPASIVMLALGMAGVGALVVRRSRKAGRK